MRPRALDEFVGQEHLVGERGPLRRSVSRAHLASMLLWLVLGSIDFWNWGNKFDLADAMRVRGRFLLAGARNP